MIDPPKILNSKNYKLQLRDTTSRMLFYTLLFCIPFNLGKHFIINEAYINGLLIDYLIPTVYLQDIIIALLVLINIDAFKKWYLKVDPLLIWFLFSVYLSTLISPVYFASIGYFLRLFLYALFMYLVNVKFKKEISFEKILNILCSSVLFLSLLGILQWHKQGAVFNNYIFFGEQPYTISTPNINVESFFGFSRVPPYGTFRHSNVFAGFLAVLLLWIITYPSKKLKFIAASILGFVVLFFCLSKFAWISFALGMLFYNLLLKKQIRLVLGATVFIATLALLLPFLHTNTQLLQNPSFYRRVHLLNSSYELINLKPFFGVGYNASTAIIDKYLPPQNDVRFAQPVHNIFVLLAVESGLISAFLFVAFLVRKLSYVTKGAYAKNGIDKNEGVYTNNDNDSNKRAYVNVVLKVAVLQVIILGSFDHYFITMQQTQLLMWLILGLF